MGPSTSDSQNRFSASAIFSMLSPYTRAVRDQVPELGPWKPECRHRFVELLFVQPEVAGEFSVGDTRQAHGIGKDDVGEGQGDVTLLDRSADRLGWDPQLLQRVDQPDALEITQRESLVALLSDGHEDAERCKLLDPFERAPATTGKLSLGQSWHRLSDGIGVMERAGYGRRSRVPRGTLHQAHSNPRGERRSDVWRQPRNANGTASGGEGTVLFIRHRSADHRSHPDCGAPDDGVTPPSWCAFSRPTSGPPGPTRPR